MQDIFCTGCSFFATRINTQLDKFVSWKDPDACHTNAFAMSWSRGLSYAFPLFGFIRSMLQKMLEDEATILVLLPLWPTQVWFPKALHFLVEDPVVFPRQCVTLPQGPSRTHPRAATLRIIAMLLSGNLSKVTVFRRKLQNFCVDHGEMRRHDSIGHISKGGCYFVSMGKLIHFSHL